MALRRVQGGRSKHELDVVGFAPSPPGGRSPDLQKWATPGCGWKEAYSVRHSLRALLRGAAARVPDLQRPLLVFRTLRSVAHVRHLPIARSRTDYRVNLYSLRSLSSWVQICVFRDALKVGKARHWKDVIRMITRGETDRLSAEPMLKYFQPLLLWLKVQNRDESVVGWNTNLDETALFQSLSYNSNNCVTTNTFLLIIAMLLLYKKRQ